MTTPAPVPFHRPAAGLAGALYLVIIAAGVWSEAAVRAPLLMSDDPLNTLAGLQVSLGRVRASIAADAVMLIADVALAVLLYRLLKVCGPTLALAAMVFRLMQAALLGANLLNLQAAVLLADSGSATSMLGEGTAAALVTLRLEAHAEGYDLGLVFFGISTLITSALLLRSRWMPRALGLPMAATGVVYLAGSGVRLLAPDLSSAFAPAYALPLLTESAFCLWLLWTGTGIGTLRPTMPSWMRRATRGSRCRRG